ncbi:MAG: site-2 protease family protein [Cyclobacteriaceae bacterium]|nr:site-2 protease family protein [Cyclobacteriaceae bacterium]
MSPKLKTILVHSSLFIVTFITTTFAGAEWVHGKSVLFGEFTGQDFVSGLPYSISFLAVLTVHEFGHYFTAIYYRVRTSLPYFIPLPPVPLMFGTLGALIRLRERVKSSTQNFDIGIAGPLAGFVAALVLLGYGFTHLPPPEYIFSIHPEYEQFGLNYGQHVYHTGFYEKGGLIPVTGKNLLFIFFEKFVADPARVPNMYELIHYPYLFAGFLSLVFTAINLLPIGQLDGGHVLYGLVGYTWHKRIASVIFVAFLFYAGLGYVHPADGWEVLWYKIPLFVLFIYFTLEALQLSNRDRWMYTLIIFTVQYSLVTIFPTIQGYPGWLLFALLIGRFVKVAHPPSEIEEPLTIGRVILGIIALLIFILCFTPQPLELIFIEPVKNAVAQPVY